MKHACDHRAPMASRACGVMTGWIVRALATLAVLLPPWAEARRIRVATFNLEAGIGEEQSEKYSAQRRSLERVNADIVAFQELVRPSLNRWIHLAGELGYAHHVVGELGPFAGTYLLGFWSRFPVVEHRTVGSPEEAVELTRSPLHVRIRVDGAAHAIALWNVHHKALFRPVDEFRRAVEARRVIADIDRHLRSRPEEIEIVVLGDFNDDPERPGQTPLFTVVPEGLPRRFVLGADIVLPLRYRPFPTGTYLEVGPGLRAVRALRPNSDNAVTHLYTNLRLDWIFASAIFWQHPGGPPSGEVYHSEFDGPDAGLPKAGDPLPPDTSLKASDHYIVFADLNLREAASAPSVTP